MTNEQFKLQVFYAVHKFGINEVAKKCDISLTTAARYCTDGAPFVGLRRQIAFRLFDLFYKTFNKCQKGD